MAFTLLRDVFTGPGVKLGSGVVEVATPGIGHILKAAGCDYAFVDMEHSGFGIDTVKQILRYMEAADLPAFVRPPSSAYDHIARCLDIGAQGLLLPMVGSAEEAKAIVSRMKYPPMGERGVAMGYGNDRYKVYDPAKRQREANRQTVCITLIETAEGVANVEAIAKVKGVDVLWIGHSDLSASLGIAGNYGHKDFKSAVRRIVAAAKKEGKPVGRLTGSVDEGRALIAEGFDLVCYGTDAGLLRGAVKSGLDALRPARKRARRG